jgi:hypothetical protein
LFDRADETIKAKTGPEAWLKLYAYPLTTAALVPAAIFIQSAHDMAELCTDVDKCARFSYIELQECQEERMAVVLMFEGCRPSRAEC